MTAPDTTGLEVAIIGMAGRFPGARTIDEFWQQLRDGVEGISFFSDQELREAGIDQAALNDPRYIRARGILEDVELFDAAFFDMNPREAEITDPQHRLFLECAWEALEHAGYPPDGQTRPVGIFGGASLNTYLLFNLFPNRGLINAVGLLQTLIGSDKDYLTTRVSYKLNLEGPSVNVQSACSTALVAVHLACQSLLNGECDMALAGGVSVTVPHKSGYMYQEEGILSPDGHCRPFDARGAGTIFSDGVGMVVLKRLADALEEGDTIYAVVRGSAVNNDGGRKVGYTAPGLDGQVKVMRAAQLMAEVEPETITYIEAHGTGTPLGDPIEVAALAQVLRAPAGRAACALGSVKSNIGHLDAAAGIAGLIKTVLALKHGMIPPSLHFETPNPAVDLAAGPFYVPTELAPWTTDGMPRRAGVSSFGIGGTNAHIILEEAPERQGAAPTRPWHLLLLSARTPTALEAATANLHAQLQRSPELDLTNVAYTLQVGRSAYAHRRMLVCRSRAEALALLAGEVPERVITRVQEQRDRGVMFLFPGQGSQYVGMAQGLYECEPLFRETVDRCAEILKPHLGLDIRQLIYPARRGGEEMNGQSPISNLQSLGERGRKGVGENGQSPISNLQSPLDQTQYAQPALFVVEYALARLWMSWGVQPQALIGHSIGEYVAACLAGVFSLEDALKLVAARGQMMQELPEGAMLAVPLSEEQVGPLLRGGLALAAVNGPALCVVAGAAGAIDGLQRQLAEREVECRRLHTSHAFHSAMMDPILEPFAELLGEVRLHPPQLAYVSNLTGTWITAEQATDPQYWARHLREPVRFGDGLRTLLEGEPAVLLEVGPGQTLATLARRQGAAAAGHAIVQTLRHPQDDQDDTALILATLGRLWLAGVTIDWAGHWAQEQRRRVALPAYPFERRRFWVDPPAGGYAAPQERPPADQAVAPSPAPIDLTGELHVRPGLSAEYMPPRTELERRLVAIWQVLLGIEQIGVHDNFFELGGHSLLATQLVTQLRETLNVELPLRSLFAAPTIAKLAELIDQPTLAAREQLPVVQPSIPRRTTLGPVPLSFAQQRVWFLEQLTPGGAAYNLPEVLRFQGAFDAALLERCLEEIVRRHESLRTTFTAVDGQPVQVIAPVETHNYASLQVRDLGQLPAAERETEMVRLARDEIQRPFDLSAGPLVRALLLRLGPEDHVVLVTMHHIISDGWSVGIFVRELVTLYGAFAAGQPSPLPALAIQYADVVLWQRQQGQVVEQQLAYWRQQLGGADGRGLPPLLELPTDRPRPAVQTFNGARQWLEFPRHLTESLRALSQREGVTLFMTLLAGFSTLLYRYTSQDDIAIGIPIANRERPEMAPLIGFFANTLVLRSDLAGNPSFRALLGRVRDVAIGAYTHQDLPFEHLVDQLRPERSLSHSPLFQVMFALQNAPVPVQDMSAARLLEVDSGTSKFDLTLNLDEQPDLLRGWFEYNTDLFNAATIIRMGEHLLTLLGGCAADPTLRLGELPLLNETERRQLLTEWNATDMDYPRDQCLHELVAAQAARTPEKEAVVFENRRLSYRELEQRANQLAHHLRRLGVGPDVLVGVCLERSLDLVVALLGVLKAGGAYVPLDPAYPTERLRYMLEDSQAAVLLTKEIGDWRLEIDAAQQSPISNLQSPVINLDADWPTIAQQPTTSPESGVTRGNLAYVIYTSGSTGKPKGVQIAHGAVVNFLCSMQRQPGLAAHDTLLAVTSLSFDIAGLELFLPLIVGARLVVAGRDALADGAQLIGLLERSGASVMQATPATWWMLLEAGWQGSARLRILCGGEAFPPELRGRLRPRCAELWNMYGPTETTIWSTLHPVEPGAGPLPIGRPIANTQIYLLDGNLHPVPLGVPGELYIGGDGLSRGYLNRPELTADRFVPNPFVQERLEIGDWRLGGEAPISNLQSLISNRLYRTGDLARYRPDGNIEYLGRLDHQVKLRGFRIELGEIEAALAQHAAVREVVVVVREEVPGDMRLVAYIVPGDWRLEIGDSASDNLQSPISNLQTELRGYLKTRLPDYMIPSAFVTLEALPLTPNGKLDRRALPAPDRQRADEASYVPPQTDLERTIVQIWQEVLRVEQVGLYDNFFDLGGHSLLMVQVHSKLTGALNRAITMLDMFKYPTISDLAKYLNQTQAEQPAFQRVLDRAEKRREVLNRQRQLKQERTGGDE